MVAVGSGCVGGVVHTLDAVGGGAEDWPCFRASLLSDLLGGSLSVFSLSSVFSFMCFGDWLLDVLGGSQRFSFFLFSLRSPVGCSEEVEVFVVCLRAHRRAPDDPHTRYFVCVCFVFFFL